MLQGAVPNFGKQCGCYHDSQVILHWYTVKCLVGFSGKNKSFAAASIAEGFTFAQGSPSRPAASTTRGTASSAAGEKALRTLPRGLVLDGSGGQASLSQQGVGGCSFLVSGVCCCMLHSCQPDLNDTTKHAMPFLHAREGLRPGCCCRQF